MSVGFVVKSPSQQFLKKLLDMGGATKIVLGAICPDCKYLRVGAIYGFSVEVFGYLGQSSYSYCNSRFFSEYEISDSMIRAALDLPLELEKPNSVETQRWVIKVISGPNKGKYVKHGSQREFPSIHEVADIKNATLFNHCPKWARGFYSAIRVDVKIALTTAPEV